MYLYTLIIPFTPYKMGKDVNYVVVYPGIR